MSFVCIKCCKASCFLVQVLNGFDHLAKSIFSQTRRQCHCLQQSLTQCLKAIKFNHTIHRLLLILKPCIKCQQRQQGCCGQRYSHTPIRRLRACAEGNTYDCLSYTANTFINNHLKCLSHTQPVPLVCCLAIKSVISTIMCTLRLEAQEQSNVCVVCRWSVQTRDGVS